MKKGFCILLALVLVLSLALTGCDAKKGDYDKANKLFDDEEYEDAKELFLDLGDYKDSAELAAECDYVRMYGSWEVELDVSDWFNDMMADSIGEEYVDRSIKFPMTLELEFNKDKSCVITIDAGGMIDALEGWKGTISDALEQSIYDAADEQGISRDDFDDAFLTEYGCTVPEYVDQMLQELDISALVGSDGSQEQEGFFRVEDGKLYIEDTEEELEDADDYVGYSIDDDELELDAGTDDEFEDELKEMGIDLPLTLTRK